MNTNLQEFIRGIGTMCEMWTIIYQSFLTQGMSEDNALKRFMDSAQTGVDRGTHCETCIHEPVCSYRAQFSEILGATQRSNGICANPSFGRTIDLNSLPYVKIDISCEHYHRKAEVRYGI